MAECPKCRQLQRSVCSDRSKLGAGLLPFGTAFIEAIEMVVIPLVFSAVTLGAARMGSELNRFGRAVVAVGWFMFATLVTIVIGLALNGIFHLRAGIVCLHQREKAG